VDEFLGVHFTSNGSPESQEAERVLRDAGVCIVTEVNESLPISIFRWGSQNYVGLEEIKEFAERFYRQVIS
jgi:hypothetical protein